MRALSAKNVVNAIRSVLGKGAHQLHEPLLKGKEINFVSDTIKRNFVSTAGEYVNRFEKAIKKFSKSNHAIAVVNGTHKRYLSRFQVLGVRKDDEVLVPALTFVGTVNAISYLGAHPHFGSSWENFGVNCDKLEKYLSKNAKIIGNRCINKSTGKVVKAIVPVHIFGHPCDIEKVIKISKKFKLAVVEDAAEALGVFIKKHLQDFWRYWLF